MQRFEKFLPEKMREVTVEDFVKVTNEMMSGSLDVKVTNEMMSGSLEDNATYCKNPELMSRYSWCQAAICKMILEEIFAVSGINTLGNFRIANSIGAAALPVLKSKTFQNLKGVELLTTKASFGDTLFRALVALYAANEQSPNTYVIQKEFFDDFRKLSLDNLQFRHIIRGASGFVQLPYSISDEEGDHSDHFWFYTGKSLKLWELGGFWVTGTDPEDDVFVCARVLSPLKFGGGSGTVGGSVAVFPKDDSLLIKDWFLQNTKPIGTGLTYSDSSKTMFNLLAYLASGRPDLRKYKNQVRYKSPTSQTPVKADKGLSREDITLVGYGYLKERILKEGSWNSKAHLGWRWCGPGRKDLKLCMISASTKSWRTLDGEEEEA